MIEFCGASLRYGAGLPLAVSRLSVTIGDGERVGICGRTGAGKSSLVVMLFRLMDPCEGTTPLSDTPSRTPRSCFCNGHLELTGIHNRFLLYCAIAAAS